MGFTLDKKNKNMQAYETLKVFEGGDIPGYVESQECHNYSFRRHTVDSKCGEDVDLWLLKHGAVHGEDVIIVISW